MKKLFLIIILLLSGCLATHEYTGIVDGLNRGLLLQDPYAEIRSQERMNATLDNIAHELRWQTFNSQFPEY